eukprot:TRINITY_DN19451_c0_g1_i1.p1 TRINITY_DN19451_c0_g1~~TRINITY_DN19451_c0_g1_i1.p1  ORF type:complete len:522 (-),score=77.59 TRINITY_DN19451_c0_g1_i1:231-1796(-)
MTRVSVRKARRNILQLPLSTRVRKRCPLVTPLLLPWVLFGSADAAVDHWYASYELAFKELQDGVVRTVPFSGSELQHEIRRFLRDPTSSPPLSKAFKVVSLPEEMQKDILGECPAMIAALYYLTAIASAHTHPTQAKAQAATAKDLADSVANVLVKGWDLDGLAALYRQTRHNVTRLQDASRAPGGSTILAVVISRCRESVDWLSTLPLPERATLHVCEKCGDLADVSAFKHRFTTVESISLPNQAMESLGYAAFLARHRDDAADYTVFLQADPMHHMIHGRYLSVVLHSIAIGTYDVPFLHLNRLRFLNGGSICLQETLEFVENAIAGNLMSGNESKVEATSPIRASPSEYAVFGSYCCSQFVVSRQRLQMRSASFYAKIESLLRGEPPQPMLCRQDDRHDARPRIAISALFEHLWHYVFGEGYDLPLREFDERLPLFLRAKERYLASAPEELDYHMEALPLDETQLPRQKKAVEPLPLDETQLPRHNKADSSVRMSKHVCDASVADCTNDLITLGLPGF